MRIILLALGAAVFGLLAEVALTGCHCQLLLGALAHCGLVGIDGTFCGLRSMAVCRLHQVATGLATLLGTIEQLRKDCECLE